MSKITYNELSSACIQENRKIVISECSKGGFTLAQKLNIEETNGHSLDIFLKNAIHIDDLSGLYNLRDALNIAIKKQEEFEKK